MSDTQKEQYARKVAGEQSLSEKKDEARLHPILGNEEVRAIHAKAREKIEADRMESAKKTLLEKEIERLRIEEGMTVEDGIGAEIVTVTIDLPSWAPSLNINMRPYFHGCTYTVQRHVANSMREMMARAWEHERRVVKGEKLAEFYNKQYQTEISPVGVKNMPRGVNA